MKKVKKNLHEFQFFRYLCGAIAVYSDSSNATFSHIFMLFADIKKLKTLICGCALTLMLTGCGAKKNVVYIQNAQPDSIVAALARTQIKVEPGDELMVFVSCDDQETSQKLSLMAGQRRPDYNNTYTATIMLPYLVNDKGDIDMPTIGPVHVAGLTRLQVANVVARKVIDAKLAKPGTVNVTVSFSNMTFSALGEVTKPGTYTINDDRLTILEALSMAGDLTIHGQRDKVWVIREQKDGGRKTLQIDLRDTNFMTNPAYYIEQNDVIYVEPDDVRAGQSTLNENTFKSVNFWTSLVSVAISVTTLIVTLSRK